MIRSWQRQAVAVLRVVVADAKGSTPRESGAFMLVTETAQTGTIGGGQLEWDSLARARQILRGEAGREESRFVLGPQANQCCGGVVVIRYEPVFDLDAELRAIRAHRLSWPVLAVFGAGHVGRALIQAASLLPLSLRWIDPRADEFGTVPEGVRVCVTDDWEREIASLKPGDGALVMTPSHTLDALIVAAALERGDLAYVGLIGSRSKRRRFEAGFRDIGLSQAQIDTLVCPIGAQGLRDKRPQIIAAFVAAELAARLVSRSD
nr:xanthine dehydrogenase accessory protein XdhC [Asaia spathodeae]